MDVDRYDRRNRRAVEQYMKTHEWFTIPELVESLKLTKENARKYVDWYYKRGYLFKREDSIQKNPYQYLWTQSNKVLVGGHTFHDEINNVTTRTMDQLSRMYLRGEKPSSTKIEWFMWQLNTEIDKLKQELDILNSIKDNPDLWNEKTLLNRWVYSSPIKQRAFENE